jgi:hypothetical protein
MANSGYGAASRYCGGKLVNRGSAAKGDWTTRFDMSARYTVPSKFVPSVPYMEKEDGGLVLRVDIFNLFNLDSATELNEFGEDAGGTARKDYLLPTAYQAPRSIRFGFDWQF